MEFESEIPTSRRLGPDRSCSGPSIIVGVVGGVLLLSKHQQGHEVALQACDNHTIGYRQKVIVAFIVTIVNKVQGGWGYTSWAPCTARQKREMRTSYMFYVGA